MSEYLSSRKRNLNIGIRSYTENDLVLDVIGNTNITGITTLASSGGITTTGGDLYVSGTIHLKDITLTPGTIETNYLNVSVASTLGIASATSLIVSGVITATTFIGNLTGTATTANNLSDAANITTGTISSDRLSGFYDINVSYATTAGIATYADTAGIATYATSSGIATYADTAGIATYATSSGIATYATNAGIATVAQGLTGTPDITVGIVTATTVYANLTGTATTATELETIRTFEITGDIVAAPQDFNGTQNVSLASSIQPDTVGLGTHTYGDYVKNITGTTGEIEVSVISGEGVSPQIGLPDDVTIGSNLTIGNDLQVNRNLNVTGNITVGGTSAYLISQDLKILDKDIIVGYVTDAYGNDASTDFSANHGGIAVASTEGTPIVSLHAVGFNSLPDTYKQIMWVKENTFAGLNTDAWMFNYGVGIGSTQIPSGVRLAVGGVQVTDFDIPVVRDINASGIITATTFFGNLTGTATTATNLSDAANITTGTISSDRLTGTYDINVSYATTAGIATYATSSGIATYATSSGIATYATNAGIATYATSSGIATYATNAGIATYATSSGIATYATNAGIATYATNAGIATYATSSGIATYANSSGIATYATSSGIATYATTAGIATSVIGGIGSITQLQVTGVSTFTNGPVFIGSGTSTGTELQRLQVTGGAYVSGNLGIGTTNPQTTLQINGVLGFGTFTTSGTFTGTNIRIGDNTTGCSITSGCDNFFAGVGAGRSNTTGRSNNFIGSNTGRFNTTGSSNNFFGSFVGYNNTTGSNNNFFGSGAGQYNFTGCHNNFFGGGAGLYNTTGSYNTFFGRYAGRYNNGSNNIFFGCCAGYYNFSGSFNVIIGPNRTSTPTYGSNQLVIGAGSTDWIIGNSSYNVGLGTTNPTSKLHVVGNALVTGIVTASSFVGNLTGTATTATNLSDAANITTGTINSARLSGTYGINVSYATTAGISTYATNAGIATYAGTAGISTVSQGLTGTPNITVGIITAITVYGNLSGTATTTTNLSDAANITTGTIDRARLSGSYNINVFYATTSGIATYATSSGIATYASTAGISTSVIGGIGSITSLTVSGITTVGFITASNIIVSGISTFTNGPVFIGAATSTGTASQPLQVTGGAYVSGNLGIGTTNPTAKLDINGGIVTTATNTSPLNISQTWNNASQFFTAINASITDTASSGGYLLKLDRNNLPAFRVFRETQGGQGGASLQIGFNQANFYNYIQLGPIGGNYSTGILANSANTGATVLLQFRSNGISISGSQFLGFGADISFNNYSNCPLIGYDAIGTLAQRNGALAQTFRVYNTYTSGTNYELGKLEWSSSVFRVGTEKGSGGGTARDLHLQTDGTTRVAITSTGLVGITSTTPQTTLDVSGSLQALDTRIASSSEKTTLVSGNTVSLVYNTGGGNVAICTNPTGPITLNVTGIPTDSTFDNRMITFSVVAIQTSIGYACTAITLNGVSRTIRYPGAVVSTASTSSYDIFNLTGINTVGSASTTANYQVLGIVNGNFK